MTQAQKADDLERRQEVRIPVIQKARIALDNDEGWQDCIILNISASGAHIEFPGELAANDELAIEFEAADIRLATVRWFRGTMAGLKLCLSPYVVRNAEQRNTAPEETSNLIRSTLETDDDAIIAITPFNISVDEERMRFLGARELLTACGLDNGYGLGQNASSFEEKASPTTSAIEAKGTDDLAEIMLTGKQAFELLKANFPSSYISLDSLEKLMDSDFKSQH